MVDWKDLTEKQIQAIRDKSAIPIIAVIDGISSEDRKLIYNSIITKPEYAKHFEELQSPWISDFKGYWGKDHDKNPDDCVSEFSTDYLKSCECERFRLYYAAKYPERVEITKVSRRVLEFFLEADEFMRIGNLINSTIKK